MPPLAKHAGANGANGAAASSIGTGRPACPRERGAPPPPGARRPPTERPRRLPGGAGTQIARGARTMRGQEPQGALASWRRADSSDALRQGPGPGHNAPGGCRHAPPDRHCRMMHGCADLQETGPKGRRPHSEMRRQYGLQANRPPARTRRGGLARRRQAIPAEECTGTTSRKTADRPPLPHGDDPPCQAVKDAAAGTGMPRQVRRRSPERTVCTGLEMQYC